MLLSRGLRVLAWASAFALWSEAAEATRSPIESYTTLTIPSGPVAPQPPPDYAKGHANNAVGVSPDKHNMTGPYRGDKPTRAESNARLAAGDGYWLSEFGPLGKSPLAPAGYQFFRNVKDFGAVGDGVTDDTAAINRAVSSFSNDNQDDLINFIFNLTSMPCKNYQNDQEYVPAGIHWQNSESVVLVSGSKTLLAGGGGPRYFNSWVSGFQTSPSGVSGRRTGFAPLSPDKPSSLLDGQGRYYYKSKPQYEGTTPLVATNFGVRNDGTGDQTTAINNLLSSHIGAIIFFPAGVYMVRGTIKIPIGSIIMGSSWSTIMGIGLYFSNEFNPKVMVYVGKEGDKGKIKISNMLFTVKGFTKGAILMEWNISLGFFDNIWIWVADHDLDDPANANTTVGPGGIPNNSAIEIAVYMAHGVLIESQGPSWFWGCASEHAQLYQWQLLDAKNIVIGHIQTETPYYQSDPDATDPYIIGEWPSDPTFLDCEDDLCKRAWALRILNSTDVFMYAMGFYSFFDNYRLGCAPQEDCQKSLIDTNYAGNTWLYNIFTKGNHEIISPGGSLRPIWFNDTTRNDYTSSVAAWLALANEQGLTIGEGDDPSAGGGSGIVYIDPEIWSSGSDGEGATIQCYAPCAYVFPPISLNNPTTISFPPVTTSVAVGWYTSTTFEQGWSTITTTEFVTVTHITTLTPPPVTLTEISIRDVTITDNVTSTEIKLTSKIDVPTFIITNSPNSNDPTDASIPPRTRTITLPPWPWPSNEDEEDDEIDDFTTVTHTSGSPKPTCRSGCGSECKIFCGAPCLLFCSSGDWPHPPSWYDPEDPESPPPGTWPTIPPNPGDPGEDGECETTTFESCRERCTVSPSSTCTSTCSDVVGCETTTGIPTTVTLAPAFGNPYPEREPNQRDPDVTEVAASGSSAIVYLSSLGSWTFGELGGRPTTTTNRPQPTGDPDTGACDRCANDLGSSNCGPSEKTCLINQCRNNFDCTACNFDCEGLFPEPPSCDEWWDYTCLVSYCKSNVKCQNSPDSPECRECADRLGASDCPAADEKCLLDQYHNEWFCQRCNFDCEALFN
ncbi:hypothetical protein B0I35DRAFT_411378 [Stachybotrys elegans]|uniref:Rhamnogalacturonase A/B/Epimerase-like pectate lyase domain-containing protein n=1 Tax=Stachybotrys elegans TaxID=80388 RepID=A0A8K0SSH6_9HYPO|nr:hypothetical protein B0I35DRAFT_411378 [Stachybotrys elegans]